MDKSKPLNFILIGRSGSGKGTQADLLIKKFKNLYHLSTGNSFRNLAKFETSTGSRIKSILNKGGLPFDDLATSMWMYEIAHNVTEDQGILADGFPRRLNEAKDLDHFLEFLGRKENTMMILIDISREEAYKRLVGRGRHDDTPEYINNRLDYYEHNVVPVVEYFKENDGLLVINGEQSVEDVFKELLNKINERINQKS